MPVVSSLIALLPRFLNIYFFHFTPYIQQLHSPSSAPIPSTSLPLTTSPTHHSFNLPPQSHHFTPFCYTLSHSSLIPSTFLSSSNPILAFLLFLHSFPQQFFHHLLTPPSSILLPPHLFPSSPLLPLAPSSTHHSFDFLLNLTTSLHSAPPSPTLPLTLPFHPSHLPLSPFFSPQKKICKQKLRQSEKNRYH